LVTLAPRRAARRLRPALALLLALLVVLSLAAPSPAPPPGSGPNEPATQPPDYDISNGHFYTQTGGGGGRGFAITDDDGIRFWSEFQRWGGVAVLGYPISQRFLWDGFVAQATQRVVMQWRPEMQQVSFVNVFDRLHDLGFDDDLFTARQTPRPLDPAADAGKPFQQVARERLALLDASPAIRAAYYGVPGDPIQLNGLPASPVTDMGNHVAIRCQRVVIQQWKEDVPWARAGDVTFALGGDIAKETGALPDPQALQPVSPAELAAQDRRYGVSLSFGYGPWVEPAFRLAAEARIGMVRAVLNWQVVEPEPGRYDWQTFDLMMDAARTSGLHLVGGLGFATAWNTTAPPSVTRQGERLMYPPADLETWRRYVTRLVTRYKDVVRAWEVWNEPDLQGFWGGTPAQYAQLLAVTYETVKLTDPTALVLLGGLSLGGSPGRLNERFLDEILADPAYPAARYFDVAAFHHYGASAEARRRMEYVKGALARASAGTKPVWVTEAGYPSDAASQRLPGYQDPNPQQAQARWLQDILPLLLQLGAEKVFWFQLSDNPRQGAPARAMGLLDATLAPKAAYYAYRDLIAMRNT
jgi:hypothetical protein